MTTQLEQHRPNRSGRLLDRLMIWAAAALVLAIAAFAIYYYLDQRAQDEGGEVVVVSPHEIEAAEQAVRADPQDPVARGVLAQDYFDAGRFEEAIEQYEAVIEINETSLPALYGIGRSQIALTNYASAIEAFEEILTLTADFDVRGDYVQSAYFYLGTIALEQGRAADAIAQLGEAVEIKPGDADSWYLLGEAYLANDNADLAVNALERATSFVPNYTEAYEALAVAYEARSMAGERRYALGMAAYSRGDHDEALKELQAATAEASTFAPAYAGLGLTHEALSERDFALDAYRQALELEPANFTAQAGLARLGAGSPSSTLEDAR